MRSSSLSCSSSRKGSSHANTGFVVGAFIGLGSQSGRRGAARKAVYMRLLAFLPGGHVRPCPGAATARMVAGQPQMQEGDMKILTAYDATREGLEALLAIPELEWIPHEEIFLLAVMP